MNFVFGHVQNHCQSNYIIIKKNKINLNNILFIDDKQENLDTAKLFHIDTILFSSVDNSDGLIENQINAFVN